MPSLSEQNTGSNIEDIKEELRKKIEKMCTNMNYKKKKGKKFYVFSFSLCLFLIYFYVMVHICAILFVI